MPLRFAVGDCCCEETVECTHCIDDDGPVQVMVTVEDFPVDACGCDINGSYVLNVNSTCSLRVFIPLTDECEDSCGGDTTVNGIYINVSWTATAIVVQICFIAPSSFLFDCCPSVLFKLSGFSGDIDCLNLVDEVIPYDSRAAVDCLDTQKFDGVDLSGTIITVTSL